MNRMAEYSIILNLYADRVGQEARIAKCTFSITKAVLSGNAGRGQAIKVVLLYDLIKASPEPQRAKLIADNAAIVRTFLGISESDTREIPLQLEYEVKQLRQS